MINFIRSFFIFFIYLTLIARASLASEVSSNNNKEVCDDKCPPLAKVAFTNKGVAKLTEVVLTQQFPSMQKNVSDLSNFKSILVRKTCSSKDNSPKKKCIEYEGLPDITKDGIEIGRELRPISFNLDLKKSNLDLSLLKPITCENFECTIKVQIDKLEVHGDLKNLKYDDTNQKMADNLKPYFSLTKPSIYTLKIKLDPMTGQLSDLANTDSTDHKIEIPDNAIKLNFKLKDAPYSDELKSKYAKNIRAELTKVEDEMKKPDWALKHSFKIETQYIQERTEELIQSSGRGDTVKCEKYEKGSKKRYDCFEKTYTEEEKFKEQAKKEFDKNLKAYAGNTAKFISKLKSLKIPKNLSDDEIIKFVEEPTGPFQTLDLFDVANKASYKTAAYEAGFNDEQIGAQLVGASIGIQAAIPNLLTDTIRELAQTELIPSVVNTTNAELALMPLYWNQLTSIPNLNLQALVSKNEIEAEIAKIQSEPDKDSDKKIIQLRQKLNLIDKQIDKDWSPIDTNVLFSMIENNPKLIGGYIFSGGNKCPLPKKFKIDSDDFDLLTELSPQLVEDYFKSMVIQKKLNFCSGSQKSNCEGGHKVEIKTAPEVRCENGQLKLNFAADIDGRGASSKITAIVENCSGSPCFQFNGSESKFNGMFINLFAGSVLNRAISSALKQANRIPQKLPNTILTSTKTNPTNCNTEMKWNFHE